MTGLVRCLIATLILSATVAHAGDRFGPLKLSRLGSGSDAPGFQLRSLDGNTIGLEQLAGRMVVLNFWATWCGPCKEEMPSLQRLQERVGADRLAIVAITTDLQPAAISQFMQQVGATFPTLLDEDQEVSRAFMVRGLPTTILIDREGRQLARAVGPRAWDSPDAVALVTELTAP